MFTVEDLCEKLKLSRQTLYRMRKKGVLPAPLVIGDAGLRWREEDIERWLDWLAARANEEHEGRDPNRPDGPAPPVLSTGEALADPRAIVAKQAEEARQARSQEIRQSRTAEPNAAEVQ